MAGPGGYENRRGGYCGAMAQPIAVIVATRPAIALAQPPVPAPDAAAAGIAAQLLDLGFRAVVRRQQRARLKPLDRMADRILALAVRAGRSDVDFRDAIAAFGAGSHAVAAANGSQHGAGPGRRGVHRGGDGQGPRSPDARQNGEYHGRADMQCTADVEVRDGLFWRSTHIGMPAMREFPSIAVSPTVNSTPSNDGDRKQPLNANNFT